ncbi:MAG: protoheme IX farnesyltransferase [Geobacteraceae bacterium]|nr:protoheme IX farnesyltransferase [Geobacteraceae bacterium]
MAARPETCQATVAVLTAEQSPSLPTALLLISKPGIVLAETLAGFAGILLASSGQLPPASILCWTLLSLIMAASGAAMGNCLLDAAADRQMPRLAARSRALSTAGNGLVMTLALLLTAAAFLITALFLNSLALLLLIAASGSYLLLYTLWFKRSSPWGVLAGTIPGALPPLIGAAAVTGQITALPLLLAGIIIIWQLPHFWFLALQYLEQYRQAGFPVLPVTHGMDLTKRLTLWSAVAILPALMLLSLSGRFSEGFMLVMLLTGITFPLFCHHCLYRSSAYRAGFRVSLAYLAIILVAIIIDRI